MVASKAAVVTLAPALAAAERCVSASSRTGCTTAQRAEARLPCQQRPGAGAPPVGVCITLQGSFEAAPPQLARLLAGAAAPTAAVLPCLRC